MSVSTDILFLNANDADFRAAMHGTPAAIKEWEDENGCMGDRPGAVITLSTRDEARLLRETSDEYGGWIVSVKDLPKDCTHILIYRS